MTLLSIVIIIVIILVYYSIKRKCGSLTGERKLDLLFVKDVIIHAG